ncbi:MAG: hypothetical protein ACYDDA_15545 [Acidiferrobacteraceae bacterium]
MANEPTLTEAEQKVITCAAQGTVAQYTTDNDQADDPAQAGTLGPGRTISAEVIYALAMGTNPAWPVHPRGIQITGARITGSLDFQSAEITRPLVLHNCALERVDLQYAQARLIDLSGSHVLSGIVAICLKVSGNLILARAVVKDGIVLEGARIDGNFECAGGHVQNPDGDALSADRMHVGGSVFLSDGFTAEGTVRLPGAEIGGQLACSGGGFKNLSGDALIIDSAKITGTLFFAGLSHPPEGAINFACAQVGQLVDDRNSWPVKGQLKMDGFEYGVLAGATSKIDVQERLRWLALQSAFCPQPYEQLIRVLRRMGHEREARQIAVAKQKALRKHLDRMGKLGNWLLWATTGYGYKPWRAFFWMALLVLLGTGFFAWAHSDGALVPAETSTYAVYQAPHQAQLRSGYPAFHAVIYSIDVAVPFADLGQKTHWQLEEQPGHGSYWFFESWFVIQELAGWVLLLIAAAAPTRLVRKD